MEHTLKLTSLELSRLRIAVGQKIDTETAKPQSDKRKHNGKQYRDLQNKIFEASGL